MYDTAPTSQDCLTAHRRAADLDAHPPVPMHSLSTSTVTSVSFRFSRLVSSGLRSLSPTSPTLQGWVADAPSFAGFEGISNKTGVFKKATLSFRFQADPSYNIGTDDPDNTLILQASLTGNQFGRMTGYAAGQLGCGCHAYGHVSPTRTIGPDGATTMVSDIAAVKGTVSLKFKNRRFD